MKSKIVIGIDIGGTNTAIGLVNESGTLLEETTIPTSKFEEPSHFVGAISEQTQSLFGRLGPQHKICAAGIGAPNGNFYSGHIEHAPNLRWKGKIDLSNMLRESISVPVVLTNDANAAALGEMRYGAAQQMKNFIVVTIGTGLGSGIVIDGHILYGHSGFAGEIGHTNVIPDGRHCSCGRRGCLETYVSSRGIRQTVQELLKARKTPSRMRNLPYEKLTARVLSLAAQDGDPIAKEAFEYTGELLGRQLADSVAYTSPEAIFIFGGIAKAGSLLLEPAHRSLEANLLKTFRGTTQLRRSGLEGANAAILGAAALAWETHCQN